jgi:hypothetical protein
MRAAGRQRAPRPRPARAEPPAAAVLPAPALARVLTYCGGDVRTLCAAACVSRAWREAAADPALWRVLSGLGRCAALRDHAGPHAALADARVASLVARAGPGAAIELLDAHKCAAVSLTGLQLALAGRQITRELRVGGMSSRAPPVPRGGTQVDARTHVREALARLCQLLAPGARQRTVVLCQYAIDGVSTCPGFLCTRPDDVQCEYCNEVWCHVCMEAYSEEAMCRHECQNCGELGYELERCPMCCRRERFGTCPACHLMCLLCQDEGCASCFYEFDDPRGGGGWVYFCRGCARDEGLVSDDGEEEEARTRTCSASCQPRRGQRAYETAADAAGKTQPQRDLGIPRAAAVASHGTCTPPRCRPPRRHGYVARRPRDARARRRGWRHARGAGPPACCRRLLPAARPRASLPAARRRPPAAAP